MIDREQIIDAARACLGTPFLHQGRVIGRGLDCAGVIVHIARTLGLNHVDLQGYPRYPYQGLMEAHLRSQPCLREISIANMQPGDVLLMRFARDPQHLAINAGTTIIHAYAQIGRCVEHDYTDEWRRRVTHVFQVIE